MNKELSLEMIAENTWVQAYLKTADETYGALGYKEHGSRHAQLAANISGNVLKFLGYPEREVELARVAGYLHDIGNVVTHKDHAQDGAILSLDILESMKVPYSDIFPIISAIGSHEDKQMDTPSAVAAAVILGDKTDVNRSRVRPKDLAGLDMHTRVNYACERAFLRVNREEKIIALELTVDTSICPVMEYFEIFLARIQLCRKASATLGCQFELYINKDKFL
jgi:metal-dependent HD superfamily phosphatase/phosphodiesterase